MRACAKIGEYTIRSVQDNANDCPVATVLNDIISFRLSYLFPRNAVNTDINCQLTFSKIHLLFITCKITFWKYTRESMHLTNIYAWEVYDICYRGEKSVYRRIFKYSEKRMYITNYISYSLIIIRTCSCYRINHFYIFLYIVSNILLYSFIATFHVYE